jgi:anti-sigma factor RsiW
VIDATALHARLDGRLPPEGVAAVDRYLAEHPEERERWSDYAAQRRGLREALAMPHGEPIPDRLRVDPVVRREQARIGSRQTELRRAAPAGRAHPRSDDPDLDPGR